MPVVQFDFCYFKTAVEPTTTAILTGIDVETGMAMATMVGDKQQDQYHVNCIQSVFMKCGRVQAVLSSTILQSDQGGRSDSTSTNSSKQNGRQNHHHAITSIQLTSTGQRMGHQNTQSPITTKLQQDNHQQTLQQDNRQQARNRTMAGETHRVSTQQVRNTCGWQHQLLPQMEQRPQSATLRVWRSSTIPIPTVKQLPKTEQRFFQRIWLGRDTATGATLLGISNKVVRGSTIRRMPKPDKYDRQMFDVISRTGHTMAPPPTSQAQLQAPMIFHPPRRPTATKDTQTPVEQAPAVPAQAKGGPQLPPREIKDTPMASTGPTLASSPMATAPTSCHSRPALHHQQSDTWQIT